MSAAIKEKIARLMAMGNDMRTNEFEAEAALRQAEKLMRLHNIDVAEIQARTGSVPVYDWNTVHVPLDPQNPVKNAITWMGQIGCGVAKFTDTKADYRDIEGYGKCITFSGDRVDVEYAVWLCEHLRDSVRARASNYPGRRADRERFRQGMVWQLVWRMDTLLSERKAQLNWAVVGTSVTALVVVEDKIALRDKAFGTQRSKTVRRNLNNLAATAGKIAGDNVGLNRPVAQERSALV